MPHSKTVRRAFKLRLFMPPASAPREDAAWVDTGYSIKQNLWSEPEQTISRWDALPAVTKHGGKLKALSDDNHGTIIHCTLSFLDLPTQS